MMRRIALLLSITLILTATVFAGGCTDTKKDGGTPESPSIPTKINDIGTYISPRANESPVTVSPTETPSVSAHLSEEEAREIALSDPEIQEKIRGYTINVSVRGGHLGPPDADVAYVVYIEVFDPCTGSHVITHLVSVNDEGEIVSKYYLTPPKIPPDLPKTTSSGAEPTVTVTPLQSP